MKIEAGFTCDSSADWITGGCRGGASLPIAGSRALIGLSGRLPGGTTQRELEQR